MIQVALNYYESNTSRIVYNEYIRLNVTDIVITPRDLITKK